MSELLVNTIKHTGGTTGMGIDSNGVATRNVIPAWNLNLPDDYSGSNADTAVQINDWGMNSHSVTSAQVNKICFLQGGCTLSTGVVTVPVTGLYNISTALRLQNIGSGDWVDASISINNETNTDVLNKFGGAEIHDTKHGGSWSGYPTARASAIVNLTANDNVRVMVVVNSDTAWGVNITHTHFKGYLIG